MGSVIFLPKMCNWDLLRNKKDTKIQDMLQCSWSEVFKSRCPVHTNHGKTEELFQIKED